MFVPQADARPHELDRTLWRCNQHIILAFWGEHCVRADIDWAMLAMGIQQIHTRSDFALVYGPRGSFTPTGSYTVALRRTEWPYGQRSPVDYGEAPLHMAYTLVNDHLFTRGSRKHEPLECVRQSFDGDFEVFMDARYGGPPPAPAERAQPHELDRTVWQCGAHKTWAFWGDHLVEVEADPATKDERFNGFASRTEYALRWKPGRRLTARRWRIELAAESYEPRSVAGRTETLRYELSGDRLVVSGKSLGRDLRCTRKCFDLEYLTRMDRRYHTFTPPDVLCTPPT
ncbi:hypothetical protein [Nannocystis punicea]|uniref:Uncharacterized protein n=1 Tax=Nannocystis punicea TaxID=2995304 RepID=A0ABY7H0F5_9BACT|nr:hypothetical protein [Nannocystis poenicansa]WAS92736.1 hypothetical protein O0S08_41690 [Nannocystis poenicansa]